MPEPESITPPESDDLSPVARLLAGEMRQSRADQAEATRRREAGDALRHDAAGRWHDDLMHLIRDGHDQADTRHRETLAALGRVEDTVDEVTGADRSPGAWSRVMTWAGGLPMPIQLAAAVAVAQLALNLSGAAYAAVVGSPPPQVTVPVALTGQPVQVEPVAEDDPLYGDGP